MLEDRQHSACCVQVDADAAAKADAAAAADPAEAPLESLTTVEAVQAAMDAPGVSKTRKQKLKQRLKQLQVCQTSRAHALGEVTAITALTPSSRLVMRICLICPITQSRGLGIVKAVGWPWAAEAVGSRLRLHLVVCSSWLKGERFTEPIWVQDAAPAAEAGGGAGAAEEGEGAQDTVESVQRALDQGGLNANHKKKLKAKLKKLQVHVSIAAAVIMVQL
jgi:hypothetical protein